MIEKEFWKPGNMLYPIPAVMVSCIDDNSKPNIITIAWVGTVCSSPAMVSISIKKERYSYNLIKNSKEFVINLVTEELVNKADYCGVKSGRDVDKFKEMKLTPMEGKIVKAPLIAESPVNIECIVKEIISLGSHDMFLAEVVNVAVDKKLMDSTGRFRLNQAGLTVYSHGEYYGLGEYIGKFGYSVKKKIIEEEPKSRMTGKIDEDKQKNISTIKTRENRSIKAKKDGSIKKKEDSSQNKSIPKISEYGPKDKTVSKASDYERKDKMVSKTLGNKTKNKTKSKNRTK